MPLSSVTGVYSHPHSREELLLGSSQKVVWQDSLQCLAVTEGSDATCYSTKL